MKAIERNLLSIDDLDAAAARLGLDAEELLAEPHSYVDRFGEYKAPFGVAVKVAKHCCERFAREVLRYLQAEEEEIRQELVSGNRDVSRAWWTDNEAYRERAEARLEESRPVSPSSGSGADGRPWRSSAKCSCCVRRSIACRGWSRTWPGG